MRQILLLVEDDRTIARALEIALEQSFVFDVVLVRSLQEALIELSKGKYHAIICNLFLPDSRGKETLRALQKAAPKIPVIVITGNDNSCNFAEAIQLGAQDYLETGDFSTREMVRVIRHAIERHKVRSLFMPIEEEMEKLQQKVSELTELVRKGDS